MRNLATWLREFRNRNKPKYSLVVGGPRTFSGVLTSGEESNSVVAFPSGEDYLGKNLSEELYNEAIRLRMNLGPKVKSNGKGDLIVKLEVYKR